MPRPIEDADLCRKIIDQSPQGMALFDRESGFIYANGAFLSLTGTQEQQWLEDDLLPVKQKLPAAGRHSLIEHPSGIQGKTVTLKATAVAMDDNCLLYTLTDLTGEYDALHRLTGRLGILQGLIDGTPASIFSFDKDLHYTSFNRWHKNEVRTGYGVDIRPGASYREIAGPDAGKVALMFQKVMAGETIETLLELGDPGRWRGSFHVTCNPLFDQEGAVTGMGVFCQDITDCVREQKDKDRLQEEIIEKRIFLEGLLENLPVILYRLDARGIITTSAGAGLRVVPGWSNDLLVGMNGFELATDMVDAFNKAASGEPNRALNVFNIDGDAFYFDTTVLPDSSCRGGIIGFAVDVTATKRAETALAESHRQLKQQAVLLSFQNKFKDKILSIVSHDLRQPMAAIASASGLLSAAGDTLSATDLNQVFNELNDMAHKSIRLLEGILCWVRSEKEGYVYHPRSLVLSDTISEANGIYRYEQQQKLVTFINKVPGELIVYAHKQMLLFINRNLISNATRYSSGGSIIRVDATLKTNEIIVSFTDEGPGIPPGELEDLFKPGTADDGAAADSGAGMALNICQDLVQCMGGRIWAESLPGKGTMFCYALPVPGKDTPVHYPFSRVGF